jgi:magnesium-transporting ATPase (P-type)
MTAWPFSWPRRSDPETGEPRFEMKSFSVFARKLPRNKPQGSPATPASYWSLPSEQLLSALQSTGDGLTQAEAENRLKQYGPNALKVRRRSTALGLFLRQLKSPLVLILIFAAVISAFVREWTDAVIVLAVVIGSTRLGFVQEYRAGHAVEKLRSQVTLKSSVLRDGQRRILPSEQVVPGDVVLLSAGSLIPAAGVVLEANDFFIDQAVLTGDNQKVARHVAEAVNFPITGLLTGGMLNGLGDEALWHAAERTTIFAEVDPNQKERIILALRKTRHVVGYMGDGINDAPALHAADVSISVDTAVDVAKEAADFVLLKQDLDILREGIEEGRVTFANTLKYILTTISANFGNMFSMAGASLVLPYLPFQAVIGFIPLPASLMLTMIGITALYVLATELAKKYFHSRMEKTVA